MHLAALVFVISVVLLRQLAKLTVSRNNGIFLHSFNTDTTSNLLLWYVSKYKCYSSFITE